MHKLLVAILFALIVMLAVACGSSVAPAGTGSSKPVNIKVETVPTPASMGDIELIFTIADASGSPIEGAQVDVSADHADMTGMTMGGAAAEQGGGRYVITANFSMTGNWLLTVYVREGAVDYKEDIQLTVRKLRQVEGAIWPDTHY